MSRGKKGSTLIKKVKSTNYEIKNVFPVSIHDILGLKIDGEFKGIKITEIPIMDLASTGSTLSKKTIDDTFIVSELKEIKINENEVITRPEPPTDNSQELTIDDFIEDFKL